MNNNSGYLASNDLKAKYWEKEKISQRKMQRYPSGKTNEKKSCHTQSTKESLNSLQPRPTKKTRKRRVKSKKSKDSNEDSFEKRISETSGLSLEEIARPVLQKFYYLPNLKQAYTGKNERQRKVLIDQFSKFLKNLFKNNFKQNEEFLKLNKVYCPVRQPGKKCLMLDLDETLIFAHNEVSDPNFDEQIELYIGEGRTHTIFVYYRPFLREFLEYVSKKWEIGIFTSSSNIYANAILQRIDPQNKFFSFRLFKNSCYRDCNNHLIKDLDIMGNRDLRDLVMVDNSIDSVIYQLDNCVPVVPFYGDSSDQELVSLAKFLDLLHASEDVRAFNADYFRLKEFLGFDNLKAIQEFVVGSL